MGASLSVNLTQTGKNETNRTATVNVVVTITSTAGTHNNYGSSTLGEGSYLTVTLDGSSIYSSYVTFGSSNTGTYTTTVYSGSATVSYGSSSTRTISASATCVTATSAGTISDSASLTLTSISSSSGGGSSGGDDDDDEGEGSGGNTGGGGTTAPPGNATIVGQAYVLTLFGEMTDVAYGTDSTASIVNTMIGDTSYQQGIAIIKFTTPKFNGVSKSVDLNVSTGDVAGGACTINVGISTDDDYFAEYLNNPTSVSDPYQIASGTIQLTSNNVCSTNIPTTHLESETTYYVFLWSSTTSDDSSTIQESTKHSINVNYTTAPDGLVYIDTGTEHGEYQLSIEDGTDWHEYEVCIDNGTSWDLYG